MICPSCKQHNPDERLVCWNCGAALAKVNLGQPKRTERRVPTAAEDAAVERRRVERSGMRILAEGTVLGALTAAAIGAALGALPVLTPALFGRDAAGQQSGTGSLILFYVLRNAVQGAFAGAIVGGAVSITGGGSSTGWQVGALVNALAFTVMFAIQAYAFRASMPRVASMIAWSYCTQLLISGAWGAGYGWLIGSVVSARLDRWS